jgi:F-type H+-transporting ATPase subunit b
VNITLTLIAQSLTFLVFVWVCWKYLWPPMMTAMNERRQAIAAGLESAARAEKDLELAQQRATEQLREAKEEARQIIEQARLRSLQMIEEAKADGRAEGERQKEAARAEIEVELNRAKEALRGQVAALAVSGAERILTATVDRNRHAELLSKLAAEL